MPLFRGPLGTKAVASLSQHSSALAGNSVVGEQIQYFPARASHSSNDILIQQSTRNALDVVQHAEHCGIVISINW
jgi:hypothetical protein